MRAVATGWARSTRRRYAGAMALAVLCLMLSEGPGRAAPNQASDPGSRSVDELGGLRSQLAERCEGARSG